jgi:23S rRNA (guanine745-N1)-methyltransferase
MTNTGPFSPLICPVCSAPLEPHSRTFVCSAGHSFDLAKEGYLNLLLSHQRRSAHPGDDGDMVQARRRFFDSGAFDPLKTLLTRSAVGDRPGPLSILDCGCGEGSLSGRLSANHRLFGIDISKEAVRCAARGFRTATWIVANGMRTLPLAGRSMDVILSVLAPRNPEEFLRILKPDGKLLLVVPGPNHLIELRSRLSPLAGDFEEKADEAAANCLPHFAEIRREMLSFQQSLTTEQLRDLIQMTPIFWCSGPDEKAEVRRLDKLTVTVSFVLLELAQSSQSLESLVP